MNFVHTPTGPFISLEDMRRIVAKLHREAEKELSHKGISQARRVIDGEVRKVPVRIAPNGCSIGLAGLVGFSMACVKDDDAEITWDSVGMAQARP